MTVLPLHAFCWLLSAGNGTAQDIVPPGHAKYCLCCRPTRCTPSEGAPDQPQSTHWRSVLCIRNHRCCVPLVGTAQSISSDLSSLTGLLCTDFQHKTAWCFVEVLILASNNHLLPLRSPATCKPHLVPHATNCMLVFLQSWFEIMWGF